MISIENIKNVKNMFSFENIFFRIVNFLITSYIFKLYIYLPIIFYMNSFHFFSYELFSNEGLFAVNIFSIILMLFILILSILTTYGFTSKIINKFAKINPEDNNYYKNKFAFDNTITKFNYFTFSIVVCFLLISENKIDFILNAIFIYLICILLNTYMHILLNITIPTKITFISTILIFLFFLPIIFTVFGKYSINLISKNLKHFGIGGEISVIINDKTKNENCIKGKLIFLSANNVYYKDYNNENNSIINIKERNNLDISINKEECQKPISEIKEDK